MGNICELLINIVRIDVPKLLTGINQKVRGQLFLWDVGIRRYNASGEKAGSNPVV
ncbi:hypothetical protein SAMN04490183_5175 [Pseudomonas corrugata]|uniref:Uncharacterized protein n=1 Tax=Pseudomonas corrugata TaxID=47879 RepID=A0A3M3E7J2_9PSED|nr:hypothetical protein ALQ77_01375 [Pseudomonas corrugata]SDV11208.1 hypothetical protein SAMN04490183_5175 [Pseudomonas corrugata]